MNERNKLTLFLYNISRKIYLENEIIIYRHILERVHERKTVDNTITKKTTYAIKAQSHGSINIGKH